jgi:hypothetical protein
MRISVHHRIQWAFEDLVKFLQHEPVKTLTCKIFGHAAEREKMHCYLCSRCNLITRYK